MSLQAETGRRMREFEEDSTRLSFLAEQMEQELEQSTNAEKISMLRNMNSALRETIRGIDRVKSCMQMQTTSQSISSSRYKTQVKLIHLIHIRKLHKTTFLQLCWRWRISFFMKRHRDASWKCSWGGSRMWLMNTLFFWLFTVDITNNPWGSPLGFVSITCNVWTQKEKGYSNKDQNHILSSLWVEFCLSCAYLGSIFFLK